MSDIQGVVLELFSRHHQSLESRIVEIVADALKPIHQELHAAHAKLDAIQADQKELKSMSQTVQATIDANNARLQADIDAMTADLTAISDALKAAIPPVGQVVSQASADAFSAQVDRLDAMKAAMDTLAVPATPPTP